ncbi:hypothetical protein YP516_4695 (plasmid) [Yersinia pestis Nepal516]|nr:hypothetical protein YP516_4695 [Yersinia pestis Nepal516]
MIKGYLMAVSAVVSVCFIYGLLGPIAILS